MSDTSPGERISVLREYLDGLVRDNAALRTALRPFADDAKDFTGLPDSALICDEGCPLMVGDLRRAATLLGAQE